MTPFISQSLHVTRAGPAENSSAQCCLRQKLLFLFIQVGEMQHVRALQTDCSSQTRGSVYGRVQQSVRRRPVRALPVGVGVAQSPCDEGQASSLGEALVTVHTCRLLLQPRRRFQVQSPWNHCPRGRTIHGGPKFFNIIHNSYCQGLCTANYTIYTCVFRKTQ